VSPRSRSEYLQRMQQRYIQAPRAMKSHILTEVCATTGCHRKAAIRVLNAPRHPAPRLRRRRGRPRCYGPRVLPMLLHIWEAAGCPWSVRFKALLPLWLPWAKRRYDMAPAVEHALRSISPRTIDRLLGKTKRQRRRQLYGRTKPGTLLKHQIPVKTEHWAVSEPGYTEVDLVSHSGNSANGEFIYSLNLTDIHSGWGETRAVLGKGQRSIRVALDEIRTALPFRLRGLDSDNGSEFINRQIWEYCTARDIDFTRGRPYKKDDNAHIEQKNWTQVRKVLGWDRYESPSALAAINDLYRHEWRLMTNLFQPSVKLREKTRIGARYRRRYDAAQTPLDRLQTSPGGDRRKLRALRRLRNQLDPFELSTTIERKLQRIFQLAHRGPIATIRHPLPHQHFALRRGPTVPQTVAAQR